MVTKAVMDEKNANTPTNEPIKSDGKETKEAEQLSAKEVAEVSRPAAQDYGLVPAVPAGTSLFICESSSPINMDEFILFHRQ